MKEQLINDLRDLCKTSHECAHHLSNLDMLTEAELMMIVLAEGEVSELSGWRYKQVHTAMRHHLISDSKMRKRTLSIRPQ